MFNFLTCPHFLWTCFQFPIIQTSHISLHMSVREYLLTAGAEAFYERNTNTMDDIFTQVRDGNSLNVRLWLDNTENDLNIAYVPSTLYTS